MSEVNAEYCFIEGQVFAVLTAESDSPDILQLARDREDHMALAVDWSGGELYP
jgi:hypothetical protein